MPTVAVSPPRRTYSWSLVNLVSLIDWSLVHPVFSIFRLGLAISGGRSRGRPKVAIGHEGHRGDLRRQVFAAHDEIELRAEGREGRLDIAHGERAPERRAEAARGDSADLAPVLRLDLGAFARRRLAVRQDTDALARRTLGELPLDALGAGKAAFLAPSLLYRPGERRLDGRGRRVDVMAVEAKPGLEPQRIARAEPDRLHCGVAQQGRPNGHRMGRL